MSLNSIMNIATSGLFTAQEQLRVTSDNITNVNTPGYIRKIAHQQSLTIGGQGIGVTSGQITLASDRYLQQATFKASGDAARASQTFDLLDQIQAQFGDLTDTNSLFNQASASLTAMAKAAETPDSSAGRQEAVSNLTGFINEGSRISEKIQQVRADADQRISSDVTQINDLLKNISQLNASISSATVVGGDATGAQTQQTQYIDQLSKLIDVRVTQNSNGGITVRTQSGMVLASDTYAQLSYNPTSTVTASTSFNPIIVTGANGEKRDLADNLGSGELKGLLDVRDNQAVAVNDQLNEYMAKFTEALNAVHNQNSAVPAPASMTGKQLDQTAAEAINGMTGQTNFVTVDSNGKITHTMMVDFSAGKYTLDGGALTSLPSGSFDTALSTASGGNMSFSFTGGQLTLAAAGAGNAGVAVTDPATGGSSKLGQSFSQYFGLNDLISSGVPTNPNTGLSGASNQGFLAGGTISFAIKTGTGATAGTVSYTIPSSGVTTMTQLLTQINDPTTGVGRFGNFALDSNGALTFTGFGSPANTLNITNDTTHRLTANGASFGQFFSLGGAQGSIASHLSVNANISNNPSLLGLARVNLTPATGTPSLTSGDGSGGQALADIGSQPIVFAKAGMNPGGTSTLDRYGSDLAGQVGNLAATAKTNRDSTDALLTEATTRRSSAEGVNLDEELVNLTTYQQAYSASGRRIQAAKDMFDSLMNMI
jgi:flagellar hook-associated protein 1 FlgK